MPCDLEMGIVDRALEPGPPSEVRWNMLLSAYGKHRLGA